MGSRIRNLLIAVLVAFTVAFGYGFVTDTEMMMDGSTTMSEVDLLPPTASERARELAAACDAGDGDQCSVLFSAYELRYDGLSINNTSTLRRLCRKGCKRGATDLCEMWQAGDKRCPFGNE